MGQTVMRWLGLTGVVALLGSALAAPGDENETEADAEVSAETQGEANEADGDESDAAARKPGPKTATKRKGFKDFKMPKAEGDEAQVCHDPAEIKLLSALRRRSSELDERAALIRKREDLLGRLEIKLQARIEEALKEVARLEDRLGVGDAARLADQEKLAMLVDTLSSLSARKAAPLLNRTDTYLAVVLLRRLGPEKAGKLLSQMEPRRAAVLMKAMAPSRGTIERFERNRRRAARAQAELERRP